VLSRSSDVLGLLQAAADAPGGGRSAPERRGLEDLSPHQGVEQRGADRDRGLHLLLGGLLVLARLRLAGAAQPLLERRDLGSVAGAQGLGVEVARLSRALLEPDAEVTLRLPRLGELLERWAAPQLELCVRVEPPGKLALPGSVAAR